MQENIVLRDYFPDSLSSSQEMAVEMLMDFFGDNVNCFILKGFAGSGKTFLMKGIAEYLEVLGIPFVIMAPTGRAARVASRNTGFPSFTVHRCIYKVGGEAKKGISESSGRPISFYDIKEQPFSDGIIIVDEASMISDRYSEADIIRFGSGYLLNDLFQFAGLESNKIIFIGDPAQLPPVKCDFSPALSPDHLRSNFDLSVNDYEMTDVIRQGSDSGILANATGLRKAIKKNQFNEFILDFSYDDIEEINKHDFINVYFEHSASCLNDMDSIVLAYSNQKAQYYNDLVREHFLGRQSNVVKGDKLMLVHNNYNYKIDLMNGEIAEAVYAGKDLETRSIKIVHAGRSLNIDLTFRDMTLRFWDSNGITVDIDCMIFDPLLNSPGRDITVYEMKALYIDFKNRHPYLAKGSDDYFMKMQNDRYLNCLRAKYGYAVTCHKSQGGEWSNVYIDFKHNKPYLDRNYFRWAYTALTRSSGHVFAIDCPGRMRLNDTGIELPGNIAMIDNGGSELIAIKDFNNSIKMPKGNDLLERLVALIEALASTKAIEIQDIVHLPMCERYYFYLGDMNCYANFWYTGQDKITLIDYQLDGDLKLRYALNELFSALSGKYLTDMD
jgi:hypothetical protein